MIKNSNFLVIQGLQNVLIKNYSSILSLEKELTEIGYLNIVKFERDNKYIQLICMSSNAEVVPDIMIDVAVNDDCLSVLDLYAY
jgi:hypothetical protein